METGIAGVRLVARYQFASCAAESTFGPMTGTPSVASAAPAGALAGPTGLTVTRAAATSAHAMNTRGKWLTGRMATFIDGTVRTVEHASWHRTRIPLTDRGPRLYGKSVMTSTET